MGATVKPLYVLAHSWIPLTGSHMSALTIFTCPAGNILVQFCNTGEALWLLLLVRQEGDLPSLQVRRRGTQTAMRSLGSACRPGQLRGSAGAHLPPGAHRPRLLSA